MIKSKPKHKGSLLNSIPEEKEDKQRIEIPAGPSLDKGSLPLYLHSRMQGKDGT
jgi:hypothetical protein